MTPNTSWTPSFTWHAKAVAWCLALCLVALGVGWYITNRLPAPYQRYTPITPAQWEQTLSQEGTK